MKKKVLIVGATGMLGNGILYELLKYKDLEVFGTTRFDEAKKYFNFKTVQKIISFVDIENTECLIKVFKEVKPDVVLNCVGLIKQVMSDNDKALAISMNALFPHRLAALCGLSGARLIHFSTDCVFSGKKGFYQESDVSDAEDIYGRTKYLGEVIYDHCVTVRTSIIGHGLESHVSLIDWFLTQKGKIRGYNQVIYSGLPTHARIIAKYILPNEKLKGLYHISGRPIAKYDLLKIIAEVYGKKITIDPYDGVKHDLSLDSTRFMRATQYNQPSWLNLIKKMYRYYQSNSNFIKY